MKTLLVEVHRLNKLLSPLLLILVFFLPHQALSSDLLTYTVKKDDWVAKVLRTLGLCPLWGTDGYVSVLNKNNSEIVKKKGDLIRPGDVLVVPEKKLGKSENFRVVDGKVEIIKYFPRALGCLKLEVPVEEPPPEVIPVAPLIPEPPPEIEKEIEPEPEPERVPATVPPVEEPEWQRLYFISIAPTTDWSRVIGTDTTNGGEATLLSRQNYGVSLSLSYSLNSRNRLSLIHEFSVRQSEWETSNDRSLTDSSQTLPTLATALSYRLHRSVGLLAGASVGKEVFYRSSTFPVLEMGSLYVPTAFSGAHWTFLSGNWGQLFTFYRFSYLFAVNDSKFSLQSGYRHHLSLGGQFRVLSQNWGADVTSTLAQQKSSVLEKEELSTGLRLYWIHRY